MNKIMKVHIAILASLSYCYFISSKIPKGILRFLSISPILFIFTILPLHLSSVIPTGILSLFITWLSNFKLILFSFNTGPLSSSKSLSIFLLLSCFPIRTIQNPNPTKTPKFPLNFPLKSFLFFLLLQTLNDDYKRRLHPKIILGLYSVLLYLLIDVVLGIYNALLKSLLKMELEMPSDEPYLATSLQDFWGRRWNLMVTRVLRHTVYEPVRSFFRPVVGPRWAFLPGLLAAFLVSGLMHELIFYYMTRVTPTWEVTCFFGLHGVCLVGEIGVKRLLLGREKKLKAHWALSGPLTVAFVVVTADWLFFPPLLRNGVDERSIMEFRNFVDCVRQKVGLPQMNF